MTTVANEKLNRIVSEALAAVHEAAAAARQTHASDLLQERDAEGRFLGALPYTDAALREFAILHRENPDDVTIIHHLAVGHHARAWDMELRGDGAAAAEWERALEYWRAIANSADFWANLRQKLKVLDPAADPEALSRARSSLLEDLLEIHVDFIQHYIELNRLEQANMHVQIVRRSTIPPALKKRLTGRIFQVLRPALEGADDEHSYHAALAAIERFLATFPDHLPAIRQHTDIAVVWIQRLSWQDQWQAVFSLHARALPVARALIAHPGLVGEPLAKVAIGELAGELAIRGLHRGASLLKKTDDDQISDMEMTQAAEALNMAVDWARLGATGGPRRSLAVTMLPQCLNERSRLTFYRAGLKSSDRITPGVPTGVSARALLLQDALKDLREAVNVGKGNETLSTNLNLVESALRRFLSSSGGET